MAEWTGGERTEQATPRRREEARKQGQVALSPEVSPVLILAAAVALGSLAGPAALGRLRAMLRDSLRTVGDVVAAGASPADLLGPALLEVARVVAPVLLVVGIVGTAAVVAQVGFAVRPALVLPKASRLAGGWARLWSGQSLAGLLKALAKIVLVLAVAWQVVLQLGQGAVAAPAMAPPEVVAFAGAALRTLLLVLLGPLVLIGAGDWAWQKWRFEQSLKMSRQEVKDEQRQTEGDPQLRGRFRRAHRELARRRMLADVKTADVVLTNPTHVAVALRYRASESAAPRVVAKGADELAQRIRDAARAAGVPIVERRALARALFRAVRVGAEVPRELYKAVAEILAYIYAVRGVPGAEER